MLLGLVLAIRRRCRCRSLLLLWLLLLLLLLRWLLCLGQRPTVGVKLGELRLLLEAKRNAHVMRFRVGVVGVGR